GAALGELDHYLGLLFKKLKELQIDDRTLIVLTSNNGPWFGGSTGGLRGMKGHTWEGGVRVPLIVSWPGHIPEGEVSDQPAMMADLFPTILAAAKIPLPSDRVIDGRNLLPMLTEGEPSPHEAIGIFREDKLCAIVGGRYKLHGPESGPREIRVM